MSDFQIIRTVEELNALDPDTLLTNSDSIIKKQWYWFGDYPGNEGIFPLVVIMPGVQVRAARKALEEEDG